MVVCSQFPGKATASNQIEKVAKDRGDARVGRMDTQRAKKVRIRRLQDGYCGGAQWMLTVGVGCWWLCVTSKQDGARRSVATQTEPWSTSDSVCVAQFGECFRSDRECHGLRNAS